MIGEPKLDPRKAIISELERQKQQFLAAGNSVKEIPVGYSGLGSLNATKSYVDTAALRFNSQQRLQQARRAKLAPCLRKHADEGRTIQEASRYMRIVVKRAYLIAAENNIVFAV